MLEGSPCQALAPFGAYNGDRLEGEDVLSEKRVVIAGGGPVGLTAAVALARQGIPSLVLESHTELVTELRASTFHPPTIEMLDDLGIVKDLLAKGLKADKYQFRDRHEGKVAEFDLGLLKDDTRYPFRLQIEQYALCVAALEAINESDLAEVRFSHRATGAEPFDDHAVVTAETPEGTEQFEGAFAIGAEGLASPVRTSLGLKFQGIAYPERYLSQFVPFDLQSVIPGLSHVAYVGDYPDWHALIHTPTEWRVLFPTRPEETFFDDPDLDEETLERVGQERLQRVCATGRPYPVKLRRIYRVHQRVAEDYRRGRVVIAGDAAHVNNPLGGMGLNGGVHDAVNLAEKIGRIWRGEAEMDVLDRYTKERRTIAIEVVQRQTEQNARDIAEKDPDIRRRRNDDMRQLADDPAKARQYLLRSSMIESLRQAAAVE